jgi:hypothetical protein
VEHSGTHGLGRLLICVVATALFLMAWPGRADALVVNLYKGADDRWSDAQALNLTYCVSTRFGSDYSRVVQAMQQGAAKWEGAANVDFVHKSSEDERCTRRNYRVLFSVEPSTDPSLYASEFFYPHSRPRYRRILVNAHNTFNGDYRPENILGHVLGHALGFRHEHTRPESGTCFEDNRWRELTPYDEDSIMHYPLCNGGPNAFTFSTSDSAGAAALY